MSDIKSITDEQLSFVAGGGNEDGVVTTPDGTEVPAPVNGMCHKEKLAPNNCADCKTCLYKEEKGKNALGTHMTYNCLQLNREFSIYIGNN